MANRRKIWVYSPRKPPKPGVPEAIKQALDAKAGELVASTLQPRHVQPAPAALRCVCSGCRPRLHHLACTRWSLAQEARTAIRRLKVPAGVASVSWTVD